MRPIGFQGLEKNSSDNCQASVSIIRLIASALSFSDLGIHWMSNFIFFDMKVWKISIAKRCKSNFMLPISTIFAAALLSVNHLTCHPDSNGLNDSRANAIASNSRQVELFCASDESHNLWHISVLLIKTVASHPVLLTSEYTNRWGFVAYKQFRAFMCTILLNQNDSSSLQ